jgi:hypothetical protein
MGKCKDPNYQTHKKGRGWTQSLLAAYKAGATIVLDDTGEPVTYEKDRSARGFRHWKTRNGQRYDSYDVHPVFR